MYGAHVVATPERRVKDKCVKVLRRLGAYYFFPAASPYGRRGIPDLIACYRGKFIGIECKASEAKGQGDIPPELASAYLDDGGFQ